MGMGNIDAEHLINSWLNAIEGEKQAKRGLNKAECDVANTRMALGKWLMPDDAKEGEVFSVWHGDSLIEVTVPPPDCTPSLRIRTRGKSLL